MDSGLLAVGVISPPFPPLCNLLLFDQVLFFVRVCALVRSRSGEQQPPPPAPGSAGSAESPLALIRRQLWDFMARLRYLRLLIAAWNALALLLMVMLSRSHAILNNARVKLCSTQCSSRLTVLIAPCFL